MRKVIRVAGVFLIFFGVVDGYRTARFVETSKEVRATVQSVEQLRGPPKPRQKTPVHVEFELQDGKREHGITNLPFVYAVEVGDSIPILVQAGNPSRIKLNLWSELWASCLTYTVGGILVLVVSATLSHKRWRS